MNIKQKVNTFLEEMRRDCRASYKSDDTEEWFDRVFTKPLAYFWTRLFMKIGWSPNAVTILSMFIGVGGGILFYPKNFGLNLIGVLLVIWANILDSTDGQLARLTGQKSALGRVLDGMSSTLWYIAMYIAVCCRVQGQTIPFTNIRWGWIIWAAAVVCGLLGHAKQCTIADRYRNIHLFFLKNKHGSEFETSADVDAKRAALPKKGHAIEKLYLLVYSIFTRTQEATTPGFQQVLEGYQAADGETREKIRQDYLTGSRKYIQWTNILTFNCRAYLFFACLLLGAPEAYFFLEFFIFSAIKIWMCGRYERICRDLKVRYHLPGWDQKPDHAAFWSKVFFAVGVVGVIAMIAATDFSQVDWRDMVLERMHIWLPLILGVWFVNYLIQAITYGVIMRWRENGVKLSTLLRVTISGFALNHVTPVGLVGGEFYRILEMKPQLGTPRAVSSTLTFTVMNTFAHVLFWLTGTVLYFVCGCPGVLGVTVAAGAMMALCAAGVILFLRNCKRGLVLTVLTWLGKWPLIGHRVMTLVERKRATFEETDRDMEAFYRRTGDFWKTILLEFAARILEAVEFCLIFQVLERDVSLAHCIMALSVGSLIGNLLAIIPMQMGTREMGVALGLSWVNIASPLSLTACIMSRIREIIYTAIGVGLMLVRTGGIPQPSQEDISRVLAEEAGQEVAQ